MSLSLHFLHSSPTDHFLSTPAPLLHSLTPRSSLPLPCSLQPLLSFQLVKLPLYLQSRLTYFFRGLAFMNPLHHRVAALVRDSQALHQSFEDHSLILEPAKSQQQRRRKLHYRDCSHQPRPRITEETRLTRLEKHGEKIRRFLRRQYPTVEAAKGTHWYKVYYKLQDRIRLHRLAISDDTTLLSGLSVLSL